MLGGYMGKLLYVDLTKGEMGEGSLNEETARKYIGGYGLGAKVLLERMPPHADPLGPDNILGFTTGPLTGTRAIVGSRYTLVGKSPLTGGWGDANSGGYVGPALKAAGYDAVFFSGISPKPVYLLIENGSASLCDARGLWGKDFKETENVLQREHGKDTRIACIGPSGEKKALIACVMSSGWRAAGRSGLGAVMGAKRLKAIAVKGSMPIPLADKDWVSELRRIYRKQMTGWAVEDLMKYGTAGGVEGAARSGDGPIKNWAGIPEDVSNVDNISDDEVIKYEYKKHGCWGCITPCGGFVRVPEGPYAVDGYKPEYETLAAFGFMCLNENVESIIKVNDICNRAGLDTISTGSTIAFAIECYENGILTKEDTGGLELTWGNHAAIVAMANKIARREGLGDILADGVRRAAERIGKGAEKYAVHVGGQEPGLHDPKYYPTMAAAFRLDGTPGRHTQWLTWHIQGDADFLSQLGITKPEGGKFDYLGHGPAIKRLADIGHFTNVVGVCWFQFGSMPAQYLADFMQAVTGWDFTLEEAYVVGERAAQLRHAFNLREDLNPFQVPIHPRIVGQPPTTRGPNAGVTIDVEGLGRDFAAVMSWDPVSAIPSKERLDSLGLGWVYVALARQGLYGVEM